MAPVIKKDAEGFHVTEVAVEGPGPQGPEAVFSASTTLPSAPVSRFCCLGSP